MKLAIKLLPDTTELEQRLIYLQKFNETLRDDATANEVHKCQVKGQYDKSIKPRVCSKGELVLVYDQKNDTFGKGKFVSVWLDPYIIKCVLGKGAYELIDYEGNPLGEPRNGFYLKRYIPRHQRQSYTIVDVVLWFPFIVILD